MKRVVIVLCMIFGVGCSRAPVTDIVFRESNREVKDGGVVENGNRDKAEAYLVALGKVGSAEEEKKLLTEFGEWLSANDYKINVEVKNRKHVLSCPYFPPITPWTDHTFYDIKNLELLPR